MPISPVNQSKNIINPDGASKTGVYLWGDNDFTWGDILATWGDSFTGFINQSKSTLATFLELEDGNPFLLQDGGNLQMEGGSGALIYINQSKN